MAITISGSGITSANIADGTIVDADITSGLLPTKASSDPLITTNGAVGDEWINKTTGEKFICTDATSNLNVWKNQRDTSRDVIPNDPPTNPTNTGSFPSILGSQPVTYSFTFSGSTDPDVGDSVTHYLVDTITGGLSVATAEVTAGASHTFNITAVASATASSFRVRAKDGYNVYSSGVTINLTVKPSTVDINDPLGNGGVIAFVQFEGNGNQTGSTIANNGSYSSNTPAFTTDSKWGNQCVSFVKDNNNRQNIVWNNWGNRSGGFSYSTWIKKPGAVGADPGSGYFVSRWYEGERGEMFTVDDATGFIQLQYGNGSGWNRYFNVKATSGNIIDNEWHHVVAVFTGQDVRLYTDGVKLLDVNTGGVGSATTDSVGTNFYSPNQLGGTNTYKQDQLRAFDYAISDADVLRLYTET